MSDGVGANFSVIQQPHNPQKSIMKAVSWIHNVVSILFFASKQNKIIQARVVKKGFLT